MINAYNDVTVYDGFLNVDSSYAKSVTGVIDVANIPVAVKVELREKIEEFSLLAQKLREAHVDLSISRASIDARGYTESMTAVDSREKWEKIFVRQLGLRSCFVNTVLRIHELRERIPPVFAALSDIFGRYRYSDDRSVQDAMLELMYLINT